MKNTKRLYYFTPPSHALDNLENKRLKISRFSKCNDPFELAAFDLRNEVTRTFFKMWITNTDLTTGLICFSRSWRNPVMWGHYAQNHTGVCYGFDVQVGDHLHDVRYVSERMHSDLTPNDALNSIGEDNIGEIYATKFIHWNYEEEVRMLLDFSRSVPHDEIVFQDFDDRMQLKQVIIGPNSTVNHKDVEALVDCDSVEVFKSRLAFKRFEVVRQNDKSLW